MMPSRQAPGWAQTRGASSLVRASTPTWSGQRTIDGVCAEGRMLILEKTTACTGPRACRYCGCTGACAALNTHAPARPPD